MKAVEKANWDFESELGSGIYYKFLRAVSVIIESVGFIPSAVSTPCDNARYISCCFSREHHEYREEQNYLTFQEHIHGISSVYLGPNGRLSFVLKQRKGVKTKVEINYDYNQKTETTISLEQLGAMVSILGMPESFDVELTEGDMDEVLLPCYIANGTAKL